MKAIASLWALIFCAGMAVAEDKEIKVELTVPDSAWKLSIDEVYKVGEEIWVISKVSRGTGAFGLQVISTLTDSVKLDIGESPVKHFILGKKWGWENEEPYTFLKDRKEIEEKIMSVKQPYEKSKRRSKRW